MDVAFLNFLSGARATTGSLSGAIAQAIDSGVLVAGDKLPSTREIGAFLGISRTTVVRAFDNLIARGYLSAVKGSGTTVSRTSQILCDFRPGNNRQFAWSDHYTDTAKLLSDQVPQSFSHQLGESSNAAVPFDLLPVSQWQRLYALCCRNAAPSHFLEEQDSFGYRPLREAIAQFLRRTKAIVCHADQIVLYSGSKSSLAHIANLLVASGQVAVCENPGSLAAREQFRVHGAKVLPVPVDANGLDTQSLKHLSGSPDWLYCSPACQDPTGAVLSLERRQELLAWCAANNTAVIEDARDSYFRYGGRSLPTLFSLDPSGSVIYLYNFSRLLQPLASLAVAVLPEALVPLFRNSESLAIAKCPRSSTACLPS